MPKPKAKTPASLWRQHMETAFSEHFARLEKEQKQRDALAQEETEFNAQYPDFYVGAQVTIKEGECAAWYSGYGSSPVYDNFTPGMVGTIGAISVAKVSGPRNPPPSWCPYYMCIDYVDSNGFEVRCSAEYANVKVVKDEAGQ